MTLAMCHRCRAVFPEPDFLAHVRSIHPDIFESLARWPDGQIVVLDETLEPGDFGC